MQLFLIRHAQSENNARAQSQRIEDPALTRLGHEQAKRLASRLASLRLTRVVTSPFLRAMQTSEYLSMATDLKPEVWIDLHEKGGCVSGSPPDQMVGRPGMTRAEIAARFPRSQIAAEIDGDGWWGSQPMETEVQCRQRAARLLARTCAQLGRSHERVAYVMHGDFLLALLGCFHPIPLNLSWNASLTTVTVTDDTATLNQYSCVAHLPNYLVTW